MLHLAHFLGLLCFLDRRFIVFRRFSLFKGNGSCWAIRQAIAKAVAEVFPDQLGFTVYDINGSFMAGFRAQPTAIALFPVNVNDLPDHEKHLLAFTTVL